MMGNNLEEFGSFSCENKGELWCGQIKYIKNYGSHYEMRVEARSGITIIFGETISGNFLCVPAFNVGCELAYLKDKFWNSERLIYILGEVDGITVAEALSYVSDYI